MDETVDSDGYSDKMTKQTFMERFAMFEKGSQAEKELKKDNPSDWSWRRTQGSSTADSNNIRSKYKDLRVFHQPLCLIKNDENTTLSIEKDVLKEISQIEDTVNVIGIAGPYRSGKSYLLNRLAGVNRGFHIGNTTDAATKGIWVWCREHPKHKEEVLMLIDTEGIGDVDKGDEKNDNDILCLTTLLCGTFVFNLLGVVDEKFLKSLSFVSKIARNIALSNTVTQNDLKHVPEVGFFLPSFVLCLRDFTVNIPDNGTPDDYFGNCLKLKNENIKHQNQKEYNGIRLSILENFKKRRCFIFDRPAAGRKQMSRLEELTDTALSKDFLKDTRCFLEYMYGCKPKTLMDGSVLNGRMFSSLVEQYTSAIISGDMPCIDDALTLMSQKENEVAQKKAVDWFKQQIESIELPLPDDFESRYKQIQRHALQMFKKMAILDDKQEFQTLAENEMDEVRNRVLERNKAYLQDICSKELQSIYDELIKPKVTQGKYFVSGGYKKYRDDFAKLREDVKQKLPTFDSIIIDMCVLEFEGRYRKQDEEILEKAEMTETQIKKGIQDQQAKQEQEMSELLRKTELKRKEKEEELRIYKEDLEAQREQEKQELQERYEQMVNEWRKEKEDFESKIKERADLISKPISIT